MLKSHYIPHMVRLYNRGTDMCPDTRLNSTSRFIENMLCKYNECTAVIDDVHTGNSDDIKRKTIETAEEIIRRIGDNIGRGRMDGKSSVQTTFGCNAIMIGEYPFGKDSTAARILQVEMTSAPNSAVLHKYQVQKPLLVSTFYYYFIQWYVNNYDEIRGYIAKRLTVFRNENTNEHIHLRFNDAKFYLYMSYLIFLEFCTESELCSEKDKQEELDSFGEELVDLISKNQAWLDGSDDEEKEIDYLKLIKKLCKKGKFKIAPDIDTFKSGDYDGLIHYDCVCLRKDDVTAALEKKNPEVQYRDWASFLRSKKALKTTDDKYCAKICKLSGRFCCIKLDKLELTPDQFV